MIDVLIAGAGPVGMTLAIDLQRRGISFRIVDSTKKTFEGSRGKGIQPRTLEIFDMIGVADQVLEHSSFYQDMKIHAGPVTIKKAALGTHHEPTVERPYPNMMMVAQSRTEQVLRNYLGSIGGKIEYDIGLQSLDQDKSEVTVKLTNGEVVKAAYVVGCDGGRSTTRKELGLSLLGKTLDEKTMIVADFELEEGLDRNFWHIWPLHKKGPRIFAPLPESGLWQLQSPEIIAENGLEEGIYKTTGRRVKRMVWQSRFRHQTRMVDKYRVGRVFLAGDSAHIHPPSGAQGLNTGIQDAWNLGWKLDSALRTNDDSILNTYEMERLPIAADMLNLTKTLHVEVSTKRGELTNQLSLGYRDSPLAKGEADGDLHPGDRIPGQLLPDGRSLSEAMRHGGATQLIRPGRNHILIRPDGYIAELSKKTVVSYLGHEVVQIRAD